MVTVLGSKFYFLVEIFKGKSEIFNGGFIVVFNYFVFKGFFRFDIKRK